MNEDCKKENYWVEFWKSNSIIYEEDMQKQVGRTVNKVPIDPMIWELTVAEIIKIIKLDAADELIDICSGNGLLSIPFAEICRHVIAIDISKELLDRIDTVRHANVSKILDDVRTIEFAGGSFSKAVMYFAIQHFSERETVLLFKSVYEWLKPEGIFFVGDILDADKKYEFYKTTELQSAYYESLIRNASIGTWFNKLFFEKLAGYVGFKKCQVIEQPSFQINSHYRFDVLLEK